MTLGEVTHAARAGVHVLRYSGSVDYRLASGLEQFLEQLIHGGTVSGLVFDLTAAESLDSTNLGLMARANEQLRDTGAASSVIVSSNEDIDVVLRSMGFDQSFELLPARAEAPDGPAKVIATESLSAVELRRTMLEAHRALVRLSEAGRLEFEPVVACLERDANFDEH